MILDNQSATRKVDSALNAMINQGRDNVATDCLIRAWPDKHAEESVRYLLLPHHEQFHWTLAVCDVTLHTVHVYDSLRHEVTLAKYTPLTKALAAYCGCGKTWTVTQNVLFLITSRQADPKKNYARNARSKETITIAAFMFVPLPVHIF